MGRPYVLINVAATVDGKIDTIDRRGAAISSDADRQRVDALRASVDAVMVGSRTLLDEDPRLTVKSSSLRAERVARGEAENPAKVGVVSRPELVRPDARFLTEGKARIILFCPRAHDSAAEPAPDQVGDHGLAASRQPGAQVLAASPQPGVEIFRMGDGPRARGSPEGTPPGQAGDDVLAASPYPGVEILRMGVGRVDLTAAMETLASLGIRRVLVEGGGTLNAELLRLGLVDEVQLFVAPRIFGGAAAPTLADGTGGLSVRLTLRNVEAHADSGVLLRYKVEPS